MSTKLVPVQDLARTLSLSMAQMRVLIESGYLHIKPNPSGNDKDWSTWVVEARDPIGHIDLDDPNVRFKLKDRIRRASKIKSTPVHRMWIALWLMAIDNPYRPTHFDKRIELEIKRISSLKEPMRTEQAVRLMLKFRDAKTLIKSLMNGGAEAVRSRDRKNKMMAVNNKLAKLIGVDEDGIVQLEGASRGLPLHRRPVNRNPSRPRPVLRPASRTTLLTLPHAAPASPRPPVMKLEIRRLPEKNQTGIWQIFCPRRGELWQRVQC